MATVPLEESLCLRATWRDTNGLSSGLSAPIPDFVFCGLRHEADAGQVREKEILAFAPLTALPLGVALR